MAPSGGRVAYCCVWTGTITSSETSEHERSINETSASKCSINTLKWLICAALSTRTHIIKIHMYLPSLFDASNLRLPQRGGSCCSEPLRTSNGPPRHHLACLIHPEAPEGGKKYHLRPQGDEIRLSHQREERERVYNSSLIGCCRLEGRHRSCHLLWCEVMMTSAIK